MLFFFLWECVSPYDSRVVGVLHQLPPSVVDKGLCCVAVMCTQVLFIHLLSLSLLLPPCTVLWKIVRYWISSHPCPINFIGYQATLISQWNEFAAFRILTDPNFKIPYWVLKKSFIQWKNGKCTGINFPAINYTKCEKFKKKQHSKQVTLGSFDLIFWEIEINPYVYHVKLDLKSNKF